MEAAARPAVLVTGGAKRIGAALVRAFAAADWHVIVHYGHSADEVLSVRPDGAAAITGYLDAVQQRTVTMVRGLTPDELDRVVDEGWDPPVTLGVRLVSIADDNLQHVGQAAYVKRLVGG